MFLIQNLLSYYKQKTKIAGQCSSTPQCRCLKIDTCSDDYFNNQKSLRSIPLWEEHQVDSNTCHSKEVQLNKTSIKPKIFEQEVETVDFSKPAQLINHGHEKDPCCSSSQTKDTNRNLVAFDVWSEIDRETSWNEVSSNESKNSSAFRGLLGNLKKSVVRDGSLSSSCVSHPSSDTIPLSDTCLENAATKIFEEPVNAKNLPKDSKKELYSCHETNEPLINFDCQKNTCTRKIQNSPREMRLSFKRPLVKRCRPHCHFKTNATNIIDSTCNTEERIKYTRFVGFPKIMCCITGRSLVPPDYQLPLPSLDIGDISVEYFNVDRFLGRGGKIRLFLCMKKIRHSYHAYNLNSFRSIEKRQCELIQTGLSPTGHFPILIHNGKTFCETHVILRYLAKHLNEYGSQMRSEDYFADMLMEKLSYWTDDLMEAIKEILHSCCRQNILIYLQRRLGYYKLIDVLLFKIRSIWTTTIEQKENSTDVRNEWISTWYDAAVAATLFDDMQLIAFIYETNQLYPLLYKIKQHLPTYNQKVILQHFLLDYQGKDAAKHKFPMLFEYFLNVTNSPHVLQLMCECEMARRMYAIHCQSNHQRLIS
ncbi:uncharacterized protein LOC128883501 [Hylaeus volcanicus]|uniref:uncharacterized protein LOC128883501 n=1 Tax=Hylaeus volcanicus TaxID=313075 RepID=UPI0023B7CBE7|nr:uncharacterized protein LOC128883501 [Hylaeus volcanicus]